MSQHEEKIHKIIIEECLTCGKIVNKEDDYYCLSQRKEVNPAILSNESWWDTYIQESKIEEEYRQQEEKEKDEQPKSLGYQAGPSSPTEEESNIEEYISRIKQK